MASSDIQYPDLNVRHIRAGWLSPERMHEIVKVVWNQSRYVEVTVSPTGRSVQVHVDGRKWGPLDE